MFVWVNAQADASKGALSKKNNCCYESAAAGF
jgi:hypothetical protein